MSSVCSFVNGRMKSDSPRWKQGLMRFHFFLSVFFFSCM